MSYVGEEIDRELAECTRDVLLVARRMIKEPNRKIDEQMDKAVLAMRDGRWRDAIDHYELAEALLCRK